MRTHKQQWLHMDRKSPIFHSTPKVSFNQNVQVRTIPSRDDLYNSNLIKEIWYSHIEYIRFRREVYN